MLITKIISVGLDIQNTINIYSDLETNIKNILIDRYEGRCIRACFIKSINRIIKMSDCYINQDGMPNFGTINVIFEVSAIIFATGEIINGCTVVSKDKRIITCSTEYASIMLNADESLDSIQKGQKISVRVGGARYNIGALKISINAVPFLFIKTPTIYKMSPVTSDTKAYLEPIIERIRAEEEQIEQIKKTNPKGWEFFSQLLYAYKEEQKPPSGAVEYNLLSLVDKFPKDVKYLSRDSKINLVKPITYGYANPASVADAKIKDGSAKEILLILLDDYFNHLRTIHEMIEIYGTQDLLEKHKNLWIIFKKSKF